MTHPPRPAFGPLHELWKSPTSQIVELPNPTLSEAERERHRVWCWLTMSLIGQYWNGNKRGSEGEYPWRSAQRRADGRGYLAGDYLGHNIAAIAVNSRGQVLDFGFNHNEIFNSSVEHAESRLIRRLFSLTQLYELPDISGPPSPSSYANLLSDVTIYTSLESCSQCSGIMALGSVKEVVFLQRDPGQSSIGNILRNLSPVGARYRPPLPIPANVLGLSEFDEFERKFTVFEAEVASRPFHVSLSGKKDVSPSITSFLCTDEARELFQSGAKRFSDMQCAHPDYRPIGSDGTVVRGALSNSEALREAREFLDYAVALGRRGTPHQM